MGVALFAVDLPVVLLIFGMAVLSASTVAMTISLPTITFRRRRRRRRSTDSLPTQRRVITGRAAQLPTVSVAANAWTQAARQPARPTDRQRLSIGVAWAENVVDEFLESEPEVLAKVVAAWIASDAARDATRNRTTPRH